MGILASLVKIRNSGNMGSAFPLDDPHQKLMGAVLPGPAPMSPSRPWPLCRVPTHTLVHVSVQATISLSDPGKRPEGEKRSVSPGLEAHLGRGQELRAGKSSRCSLRGGAGAGVKDGGSPGSGTRTAQAKAGRSETALRASQSCWLGTARCAGAPDAGLSPSCF